jgi:Uma2 family endonuclease
MSTVRLTRSERIMLWGASWQSYVRLGRLFLDRTGLRITYDRGVLQLVTVSPEHEQLAIVLSFLLRTWTEERGLLLKSGGCMTFRRRDRDRGLESDGCFWIANEPAVRSLNRINLRRDPPPDLVIEVELTRSAVRRMPIYAALNFPEVWRLRRTGLTFHVLQSDGTYALSAVSRALPPLAPADLSRFLVLRGQTDENTINAQFRAWVRQLPKSAPTP